MSLCTYSFLWWEPSCYGENHSMQSISQTWFRWFGMMRTKYDDSAIRHCWQISPERRMVIVCGVAQIAAKKALLTSVSFFFSIHFHLYVGSMFDMRRLHLAESCASYLDSPLSDMSVPVLSIQPPHIGLPRLLFTCTSITITLLPIYYSSRLNTCP